VRRGELLTRTIASIPPSDLDAEAQTARLLDAKTKPPRSLGRLEDLACRVAAIRGSVPDGPLRPAIVVAAGDHGVAARGVSVYPQEVTAQMLAAFAGGGAAICVLAREAGARLVVVDAGVIGVPDGVKGVRAEIVDGIRGTDDLTLGPAMERSTAIGSIERGIAFADELADEGIQIVGALSSALLSEDPERMCGPGTGLNAEGLARKLDAVRKGLAANGLPNADADPIEVLAAVGGLEIAFLVGVSLGGSARGIAVMLDGFITSTAALLATRIHPGSWDSMIAATRSTEPAHAYVLEALGLEPLLDLRLRLGEGTGAALALPIVRAAIAILTDMATFDSAGVSGPSAPADAIAEVGDA